MQPGTLFFVSAAALVLEIILAINNARLVKRGVALNPVHSLLPTVAFLVFHICWWLSPFRVTTPAIVEYIVGTIASVAFLFGTAFVTSGCLAMKNEELCIDQDNPFFKLLKKLPLKFEGRSLCSISWLAAILIFVLPVFMAIVGVACAAASLVICAWTWQNPIAYFLELVKLESWPETEMRRNKKGVWVSPVPYLTALAAVVGLFVLIGFHIGVFLVGLAWVIGFSVVFGLLWWVFGFVADRILGEYEVLPSESKEKLDYDLTASLDRLKSRKSTRSILVWEVFIQIFKQKFCPKIKYCCKDEMSETNCKEYDY